jgi:hypothetical protein
MVGSPAQTGRAPGSSSFVTDEDAVELADHLRLLSAQPGARNHPVHSEPDEVEEQEAQHRHEDCCTEDCCTAERHGRLSSALLA